MDSIIESNSGKNESLHPYSICLCMFMLKVLNMCDVINLMYPGLAQNNWQVEFIVTCFLANKKCFVVIL